MWLLPGQRYTQEYKHVQKRLRSLGMQLITGHNVVALDNEGAARLRIQRSRAARELCFRRRR